MPKVAQHVEGWKLAGTIKDQPLVLGMNSILYKNPYQLNVDKSNVFFINPYLKRLYNHRLAGAYRPIWTPGLS